jgi:cell pole-organizing protein PopZ
MEEILASIRRIIESNEPAADTTPSHSMSAGYIEEEIDDPEELSFAPEQAANDPGRPVETHRRFEQLRDLPPQTTAQTSERAMSLADVAARVRAASVRQQEAGAARPSGFPTLAVPAAVQPELAEPARHPLQSEALSMSLRPSIEPVAQPAPAAPEPARFTAMAERPLAEKQPSADPAPDDEQKSLPARIEETANLLSAAAGAQVAQSFNELAAVFNGLDHRSVEEMAQDMLRPMLQEWLDDNLPTLVERLVREEIERVARGPRR